MAKKFLTLSFDDGTVYDRRFIEILNKYGIKCTFNLNAGLFGERNLLEWDQYRVMHTRVNVTEVAKLYEGHEIAGHGMKHPNLLTCGRREIIHQVEHERQALSVLCGYEVRGFAYPGGPLYDQDTAAVLENDTKVEYARNIDASLNFELPGNWYEWRPTVFHGSSLLMETAEKFLEAEPEQDMLFYVWGHSYEFEAWKSWDVIEQFCKMMGGRSDITYATNIEVKDYICGGVK